MNITVSGHHIDITPSLREYVENKLSKAYRMIDTITNIRVTLTVENKLIHRAEAEIHLAGPIVHAKSESENLYASIDELADKCVRQIVKQKEKMSGH